MTRRAGFILLLGICVTTCSLKRQFRRDSAEALSASLKDDTAGVVDFAMLPPLVQKYLEVSGAAKRPMPRSLKLELSGRIRSDSVSSWMPLTSRQVNTFGLPRRMFYMKAKMKGLPVRGYHAFRTGRAFMDIRLFSFLKVQYQESREMEVAETVTFLNDLCLFAPGALADKRITWSEPGENAIRATYTNGSTTVSAQLVFNAKHELIDFISDDRYVRMKDNSMRRMRWRTPVSGYRDFAGYHLPSKASAVWCFPSGNFTYADFELTHLETEP